jgi:hypothetical protein
MFNMNDVMTLFFKKCFVLDSIEGTVGINWMINKMYSVPFIYKHLFAAIGVLRAVDIVTLMSDVVEFT